MSKNRLSGIVMMFCSCGCLSAGFCTETHLQPFVSVSKYRLIDQSRQPAYDFYSRHKFNRILYLAERAVGFDCPFVRPKRIHP